MAQIFISHARQDRQHAKALAEWLQSIGWSVWWDTNILGGDTFRSAIERELAAANCVVVIWSNSAGRSNWVIDEAQHAAERKVLVPIQLAGSSIPIGFRQIQTLDMPSIWEMPDTELIALQRSISAIAGLPTRVQPESIGSSDDMMTIDKPKNNGTHSSMIESQTADRIGEFISVFFTVVFALAGGAIAFWIGERIFEPKSTYHGIFAMIGMVVGAFIAPNLSKARNK